MEDSKEQPLFSLRQSLLEPIFNTIFVPLIISLMLVFVFKNTYFALFLFLVLFLTIALVYYLTYTIIYIKDNGIEVKNKLRSINIGWDNVLSMSTVYNLAQFLRYQIKTKDFTLSLPMPKNWEEFEKYMVEKAQLEPEGENMALLFKINSPGLKRWKKIGQEYINTSTTDWIFGMGYVNKKTWKMKTILGMTLFIIGILGALLFYLLDKGIL